MSCLHLIAAGLHLFSLHAMPAGNNDNIGAYVESECGIVAGAFNNSHGRTTAYIAYKHEFGAWPVRPFIAGGLATGYRRPVVGSVGLAIDMGDRAVLHVHAVPAGNPALHVTIGVRF